jgi:LysR family transcriptional regulator, glycine cleavage system transcriptional activator
MSEIHSSAGLQRRLPPLSSLRAFEAAARHLSFTRAAAELHVTQAAVSHQVKALEDWLGLKLFRRQNRNVFLTEAGQAYLPAVREAFDGLAEATRRLRQRDGQAKLVVSVTLSFAAKWLMPRLGRFRRLHPEIEFMIDATDRIVDLGREEVDVALRYGAGSWPGLVARPLLKEELFPACSPALAAALRRPEDLAKHTLLHDEMRQDWRMWLLAAGVKGVDPTRGPTFTNSAMCVQAAIDGEGVVLGRSALVAADLAAGRLVRPFAVRLPTEYAYYVVHTPRAGELPRVKAFVEWLLAEAAEAERSEGERAGLPGAAASTC